MTERPQTFVCTSYPGYKDPHGVTSSITWAQLVDGLADVQYTQCHPCERGNKCRAKFGGLWSPTDMAGSRSNANVRSVSLAVIDLDHLTEEALTDALRKLLPYRMIVHASHSDMPGDRCMRVVLSLSRPVSRDDFPRFWRALIALLEVPADGACKDASRAYFLPSRPEGSGYAFDAQDGKDVDVDAVLAYATPAAPPARSLVAAGIVPPSEPIDLEDLRELLRQRARRKIEAVTTDPDEAARNKEHHAMLRRVLDGECLAPKGQRDTTLLRTLGMLANIFPPTTSYEAAFEVVRQSVTLMLDPEDATDTVASWRAEGEDMYARAMATRVARDAERAQERAHIAALIESITPPGLEEPKASEVPRSDVTRQAAPEGWFERLPRKQDGSLKGTPDTVLQILSYDDRLRGWFRWNEVRSRIEVLGGPFRHTPAGVLSTHVRAWLSAHHALAVSLQEVESALLFVSRMNPYNPVASYLRAITWDGVPRIDDWLTTYAHVDAAGDADHVRRVGARWLVSAAARALEPGCQADCVLVLEGPQGFRKTTALRILGGEYHSEVSMNLNDKDARISAAAAWIVEMSELTSLRGSQSDAAKGFITARVDHYRPPYGRAPELFPRRCVLVGTTNDESYLVDTTGNRRFWPVKVTAEIDRVGLAQDRDQLWAEAVVRYDAHVAWLASNKGTDANHSPFRWWFVGEEQGVSERVASERGTDRSGLTSAILVWWASLPPAARPTFVILRDAAVASEIAPADRVTRALEIELGTAMRGIGFVKTRKTVHGVQLRGYEPSSALLRLPQVTGGAKALGEIVTRLESLKDVTSALDPGAQATHDRN